MSVCVCVLGRSGGLIKCCVTVCVSSTVGAFVPQGNGWKATVLKSSIWSCSLHMLLDTFVICWFKPKSISFNTLIDHVRTWGLCMSAYTMCICMVNCMSILKSSIVKAGLSVKSSPRDCNMSFIKKWWSKSNERTVHSVALNSFLFFYQSVASWKLRSSTQASRVNSSLLLWVLVTWRLWRLWCPWLSTGRPWVSGSDTPDPWLHPQTAQRTTLPPLGLLCYRNLL